MGWFGGRWVAVRTESGSRADDIDRLYAVFKGNGIKSKVSQEQSSIKRILVRKKDAAAAAELIAQFENEK